MKLKFLALIPIVATSAISCSNPVAKPETPQDVDIFEYNNTLEESSYAYGTGYSLLGESTRLLHSTPYNDAITEMQNREEEHIAIAIIANKNFYVGLVEVDIKEYEDGEELDEDQYLDHYMLNNDFFTFDYEIYGSLGKFIKGYKILSSDDEGFNGGANGEIPRFFVNDSFSMAGVSSTRIAAERIYTITYDHSVDD